MRMMKAIGMANSIPAELAVNLRQLNPVPVFVTLPVSGSAMLALRLAPVFVRVLGQFLSVAAVAAAGVGFHGVASSAGTLTVSPNLAATMARQAATRWVSPSITQPRIRSKSLRQASMLSPFVPI